MEFDTPLLVALGCLLLVVAVLALLRRGRAGDMIERQRRATMVPPPAPPPSLEGSVTPHNRPSAEAAMMGVPAIRSAIERGRKIEAVKLVREATGLGLKEAKDLVDRQMSQHRHR